MGRAPCCDKANVKRGPWSPDEDAALRTYLETHGTGGNWIALPKKAGLRRCGKSCRLRWLNYLRPDIKHGGFTEEEDNLIFSLYHEIGSRWSIIASQLPGRTDNDVKNYWNTKLKKKLLAGKTNPPATANAMMNNISSTTVGSGNDLLQAGLHYYGHGSSPSEALSFATFPTSLDVHYGSLNVNSFGVKSETIGSISSEFIGNNMSSSISQECSSITSSSSPSLAVDNGLISFPGNGGVGSLGAHSDLRFGFPWDIIIDELLSDDASIDQSFADLTFTDEINPADQKLNQTSFGYQY